MYNVLLCVMKVFGAPNFFRLVLTTPIDKTRDACERIVEFCLQHETTDARALRTMKSPMRVVGDEDLAKKEESILPFHVKSEKCT